MTSDRGILYPARLPSFARVDPPDPVRANVRWFWIPEWDVAPGRVSRQHLIAYPACNLVVEPHYVGLAGPSTRASHRDLTGRGWAVGALLRPAAVPSLAGDPAGLRDEYRVVDLPELHRLVAAVMERPAPAATRHTTAVAAFSSWLADFLAPASADGLLANRLADLIDSDTDVVRLQDVATRLHVSVRTVQRLARTHVGLPPGQMIRRRRLQEAAEQVRRDPSTDLARLATTLGYSDHAHLTGEFRRVLGFTPSHYRGALDR